MTHPQTPPAKAAPAALPVNFDIISYFEERAALRGVFLHRTSWAKASASSVGDDCAFRRYFRLRAPDGECAILMEAVPDGSAIATPGHRLVDFIRIGDYLRDLGLAAPRIIAGDKDNGYLLLEDFGDISFKIALERGMATRDDLYALAVDILAHLRRHTRDSAIELPRYYDSHVHTGRRRVVDWYMPAVRGARNEDGLAEDYLRVWDDIEAGLPPCPESFQHIDYHFENLMWRDGQDGLPRAGILDFQGAMTGPVPYDLANLLEDARVDVPDDLRTAMLARYCADMSADEESAFRAWYRVLATQFHCRVIGQFIRLAVRDGKGRYLAHIPRVAGYLRAGLQDPVLAPLRDWFAAQGIDFTAVDIPPVDAVRAVIRDDAF